MGVDHVKMDNVQTLKSKFESFTIKESKIMNDFSKKITNIVS